MIDKHICVAGLGLMGGSFALALKGKARSITGVDRHAATRQRALKDGAVDFTTDSLESGLKQADFLVLAMPVRTVLETINRLPTLKPEGCLVLDFGSTKQAINDAMSRLPDSFAALGGHPMCGKETAGYHAAEATLFQGTTFILTRNKRSTPEIESLVHEIVEILGARPFYLSAQKHDQLAAAVSHLPYLLSASLMRHASSQQDDDLWRTSASGFRDVSRLSGSDPQMLIDILLTNRTAVLEQLAGYNEELAGVIRLLEEGDESGLEAWLSKAQRQYLNYRQVKKQQEGTSRSSA